jgi:hypothetical protein
MPSPLSSSRSPLVLTTHPPPPLGSPLPCRSVLSAGGPVPQQPGARGCDVPEPGLVGDLADGRVALLRLGPHQGLHRRHHHGQRTGASQSAGLIFFIIIITIIITITIPLVLLQFGDPRLPPAPQSLNSLINLPPPTPMPAPGADACGEGEAGRTDEAAQPHVLRGHALHGLRGRARDHQAPAQHHGLERHRRRGG